MIFPLGFFEFLVYGGVALTAFGAVLVIVLLLRDLKEGKLW
ncbi:MAG: hypothetical protein R3B89_15670 [Polyangiaceae bacterium]